MVRGLFSKYSEPFRSQICTEKGRKVDRMDGLQIFLFAQEGDDEQENRHGRQHQRAQRVCRDKVNSLEEYEEGRLVDGFS